jgi:apolipoprotein N-acyltransferase
LSAAVVTGLIFAAAQNYAAGSWLVWFAILPLSYVIEPRRLFITTVALVLLCVVFVAVTMYWVRLVGSGMAWTLPAVSIYWAAFAVPMAVVCRLVWTPLGSAGSLVLLPACWTLAEVITRCLPLGMTWPLAGLPLADWPVLAQTASVAAPESLSFLVLATPLALVLLARPCPKWLRVVAVVQGPGLLLVAITYGAFQLARAPENFAANVRVAVVQPNISNETKYDRRQRGAVLDAYDRLIDAVVGEAPDVIALPETAVMGLVRFEDDLTDWVRQTVIRTRTPLVFGALDHRPELPGSVYNAAIMITPYNTVTTYHKVQLVPVVEQFRIVVLMTARPTELEHQVIASYPGAELPLFELVGRARFGVMICYEDVFPNLGRRYASQGAQLLIALVNTQSFVGTAQPLQHLRRAQLTAAAVGLPMARCSNSGVSCVIDELGRITSTLRGPDGSATDVATAEVVTIRCRPRRTTYCIFGDWPVTAALAIYVAAIIVTSRMRSRLRVPANRN